MNATALPALSALRPGRAAVDPCAGTVLRLPRLPRLPRPVHRAPWALGLVALLIAGCGADPGGAGHAGDSAGAGVAAWGADPGQAPSRARATGLSALAGQPDHPDHPDMQGDTADALQAADGALPHTGHGLDQRLLEGESTDFAVQALRVLAPAQAVPHYPRLLALLPARARVGEVNDALHRARLRIDEMRPGNHSLVLVAAGAGMDADDLEQAAQRLHATGVFDRVMRLAPSLPSARAGAGPQATAGVAAVSTVWGAEGAQCSD